MTTLTAKQMLKSDHAQAAIARYYKETKLDPKELFPSTPSSELVSGSTLFAEDFKTSPLAKPRFWLSERSVASGIVSAVVLTPFLTYLGLVVLGGGEGAIRMIMSITLYGIASFVVTMMATLTILGAPDVKLTPEWVKHSSKEKNDAFARWAKARYQIDLNLEPFSGKYANKEIVETQDGQLYSLEAFPHGTFALRFTEPDQQAAYKARKELKKNAAPTLIGELPVVIDEKPEPPTEVEYFKA